MFARLREHVRPAGTVFDMVTLPMNPLMAEIVMVELANLFARTVVLAGFEETLKSTSATEIVVEAVTDPEVPVTVICALPVCDPAAVIVRVAFCFPPIPRLTIVGLKLATKPQAHPLDCWALRFTGPLKLPRLVIVIVVLVDPPVGIIKLLGLADTENPWTITVTVVEWVGLQSGAQTVTM